MNKIKDLIVSMVKDEIETNPQYEEYRKDLTFDSIFFSYYGVCTFSVYFRFKPKGSGRKPNTIRFDVSLNRKIEESISFCFVTFEPKRKEKEK